jgi:hypothetical protein
LASLAAQLRRNTPETQNDPSRYLPEAIQAAAQLWGWSRAKISELHMIEGGRKFWEEKKKKALENVTPPKSFPVTVDKMMHGLLPKRNVADRKRICQDFFGSLFPWLFPGMKNLSPEALDQNVTNFVERRFEESLTEPQWKRYVSLFQIWFPAYQRDLRRGKAKKAAISRQAKKLEKSS